MRITASAAVFVLLGSALVGCTGTAQSIERATSEVDGVTALSNRVRVNVEAGWVEFWAEVWPEAELLDWVELDVEVL